MSGFGTEVAFRLGPGSLEEARRIAARMAAAAAGCRRHVLFVDAEGEGAYGCLAEWDRREDAAAFAERPAVRAVLDELGDRLGSPPRVRLYVMEEGPERSP